MQSAECPNVRPRRFFPDLRELQPNLQIYLREKVCFELLPDPTSAASSQNPLFPKSHPLRRPAEAKTLGSEVHRLKRPKTLFHGESSKLQAPTQKQTEASSHWNKSKTKQLPNQLDQPGPKVLAPPVSFGHCPSLTSFNHRPQPMYQFGELRVSREAIALLQKAPPPGLYTSDLSFQK